MRESELQKQILDYLAYQKGKYWRVNSGGVRAQYKGKERFFRFNTMPGISDILGILPDGRFFACEVKVKSNKPTKAQQDFIDMINYWGGVGVVAYDLNDVKRTLTSSQYHHAR